MASNLNTLIDIIKDKDTNDAIRWIDSADPDTDFSGFRNDHNETLAQFCVLPHIDEAPIARKLITKMDMKSLENRDNDNNTLITSSIYYDGLLNDLLSMGVNPNTRDADGTTLFAMLAELGFMKTMRRLVEEFNIDISDKTSDSALILSAMNHKTEVVKYLLSLGVDLEQRFFDSWGKDYLDDLKNYKRLDKYTEMIVKAGLLELLPDTVKDVFVF